MNTSAVSANPHLSWLSFTLQVPSDGASVRVCRRAKTFGISVILRGNRFARWIHRGHEVRWSATAGGVYFTPADDDDHTYLLKSDNGCDIHAFWIPPEQLSSLASSERIDSPVEWRRLAIDDDPVLRPCMTGLARAAATAWDGQGLEEDELARHLVLRLAELNGGETPRWYHDRSVFDSRTLRNLVAYIDDHLRIAPSLCEMADVVGLSPSHFAKKFRRSVGFSLCRFVNMRRVQASLALLKNDSLPLAHVSTALGFSSQSHFTRVFGDLTGTSPAKFRRACRRKVF